MISVAVEPKTKGDQDKLAQGLQRLSEEDPTFVVSSDEETGQTLIAGMGELHLEIIVDRLKREFKVDANVGRPQVAYRETISKPAEKIRGRFVRQTGGSGQYGDVVINLYPQEPGAGYEFIDKIVGGKIPKEYIAPVDQGIQEAMNSGVLAGYPIVDVKVELIDGSYHDVDSSERAFKIAGSMAFKEAVKRAKPKLLEPMMAVEVITPEEYLGDVMGNLNSRRGRVENLEPLGNAQVIKAMVPLSEMFGYSTDLRSMSQGRAEVHDAVRPLRGSAAVHPRGNHGNDTDLSDSKPFFLFLGGEKGGGGFFLVAPRLASLDAPCVLAWLASRTPEFRQRHRTTH